MPRRHLLFYQKKVSKNWFRGKGFRFPFPLKTPILETTKGQALWKPAVRSALCDCQAVCHRSFSNTNLLRVRLMALYALTTHKVPSKRSNSILSFHFTRPKLSRANSLLPSRSSVTPSFHSSHSTLNSAAQPHRAACGDNHNSTLNSQLSTLRCLHRFIYPQVP